MQQKKFLNELSENELLEITENSNEEFTDAANSNLLVFFEYFDIKPGNYRINRKLLYKVYSLWSKETPMSLYQFTLHCNPFIKGTKYDFLIDRSAFKLAKEAEKKIGSSLTVRQRLTVKGSRIEKQFKDFTKDLKLSQGKTFISRRALYYIYEGWALDNRRMVIGYESFVSALKASFPIAIPNSKYGTGIGYNIRLAKIRRQQRNAALEWSLKYKASDEKTKSKKEEKN